MNPYKIEPPFVVQFSGGRTSAYMLWHVLDAHGDVARRDGFIASPHENWLDVYVDDVKARRALLELVAEEVRP